MVFSSFSTSSSASGATTPPVAPPAMLLPMLASTEVSQNAVIVGAAVLGAVAVIGIVLATVLGRRSGRHALEQRLGALATRLGVDAPEADPAGVEPALHHLEQVTDRAAVAVAES